MSSFTTPLILVMLPGYRFRLYESFIYHVGELPSDDTIVVPKGFETDLASIPRMLWSLLPPHGNYGKAAVLHDFLYQDKHTTKKQADAIFLEAMKVLGVPKWKRRLMYRAVRIFGRKS